MAANPAPLPAAVRVPRIRVFVDYWNLQLTMNQKIEAETGQANVRFAVNWRDLPTWLAYKAAEVTHTAPYQFDGGIIYASYDPNTAEGRKFHG